MSLHRSKKTALLHLINCMPSCNVETIKELKDGRLFRYFIETVLKKEKDELPAQEKQNIVQYEKLSESKMSCNSVADESNDDKMICEDPVMKSVEVTEGDSKTVQGESNFELTKSNASNENTNTPTKSVGESVTVSVESVGESVTVSAEESSTVSAESVRERVKFVDSDNSDISKIYEYVQNFIDARYNLKSELLITFSACMDGNELELAKVSIFILSEAVRYYVHANNSVIHTLSHLDAKVQQDLEQCFTLFINERSKITREEIQKILSSDAPDKNSSTRGYFTTPRSCASKYRRCTSTSTSPLEGSIYADSPLKTYFESPIFTKMDIALKEKEIVKARQILYEEEAKGSELQQKINELEKKLKNKDKKINELKAWNKTLQETAKPEECEDCKVYKNTIENKERYIQELEENKDTDQLRKQFNDILTEYQEEVSRYLTKIREEHANAEITMEAKYIELDKANRQIVLKDELIKGLTEKLKETENELDVYKEKLSEADNIKESPESSVIGECIGSYIEEENKKRQLKFSAQLEDKSVQCTDLNIDCSLKNEYNVPMPEMPSLENISKNINEGSDNVSSKLKTASTEHSVSSTDMEVPHAENSFAPIMNDGIGSLWRQYNSFSENEEADGTTCVHNDLVKALNTVKETEYMLSQKINNLLAQSKASSGPNGSNGFVCSPVFRELLEDLKSFRSSLLCISQTEGSEVNFQNNNSVFKNTIVFDDIESNSDPAIYSKDVECMEMGSDAQNNGINSANQDLLLQIKENQETIDNLNKKYEAVLKSLNLKKRDLEIFKEKYSNLKFECRESIKLERGRCKDGEIRCQKLEIEIQDIRKALDDIKRISERHLCTLKTQNKELRVKNHKLHSIVLSHNAQMKEINEKNAELLDDIISCRAQNEQQSLRMKYLETELEVSNVHLKALRANTHEQQVLQGTGGFPLFPDDEEAFLNHSSIAEINRDYESMEAQSSTRLLELKRRNTFYARHLKSCYPAEGVPVTPTDNKTLPVLNNPVPVLNNPVPVLNNPVPVLNNPVPVLNNPEVSISNPESQSENNEQVPKKRKASEIEDESQSSKLLATPTVKSKTFKAPTSLQKLLQFRRRRRPAFIKPKP